MNQRVRTLAPRLNANEQVLISLQNYESISGKRLIPKSNRILENIPEENENYYNEDKYDNNSQLSYYSKYSENIENDPLSTNKNLQHNNEIQSSLFKSLRQEFESMNLNYSPLSKFSEENNVIYPNDSEQIIIPRRRKASLSIPIFDQ